MVKAGERAYALLKGDQENVYLFGFGVYDGEHIPPPEAKFFGQSFLHENPRITLDDGKQVFGFECWWGAEANFENMRKGRAIVKVDIEEERKRSRDT